MGIEPDGYLPRIVDEQVERYLRVFGAVEIAGTKWCGKTWTARRHGASITYVDQGDNLAVARADPSMMLLGDRPHVIDEWQREPGIWDAVRHGVDEERRVKGAWILTGSSTPRKRTPDERHHSGAGRIGRIRMLPMSLAESGDSTGSVSLSGLFRGEFEPCAEERDTMGLVGLACRGGWPEAIESGPEDAQLVAREYLNLVFGETVPDMGRDGFVAERICGSIARNLGQATTYRTLAGDVYGAEERPEAMLSEDTASAYLHLLRSLYLVEEVPGWAPPARSKKRFTVKPKRYLADPSLAVALLGMGPGSLVADWQTFGLVFENLCMRDLSVYARALPGAGPVPVRYYRDDSGLEVDAVIERADGSWAALEVKVSEDKVPEAERSLLRMRDKLCGDGRARVREPEFMAVLVGISGYARRLPSGVLVIPVRALTA